MHDHIEPAWPFRQILQGKWPVAHRYSEMTATAYSGSLQQHAPHLWWRRCSAGRHGQAQASASWLRNSGMKGTCRMVAWQRRGVVHGMHSSSTSPILPPSYPCSPCAVWHTMPCHAMPCHVMPCHVLWHAMAAWPTCIHAALHPSSVHQHVELINEEDDAASGHAHLIQQ